MSLDVRIVKNNDVKIRFSVKNPVGNAINITDYIIKWEVRKTYNSLALITKTTQMGNIVIEDPLKGVFSVLINAEDTKTIQEGVYYHEAVITNSAGDSVTLTDDAVNAGQFILRDQYTRQ